MSRSLRRGAIAALVLAIAPLSACAASNSAESLQVKPDNAATSIGNDLKLSNILLVTGGAEAAGDAAAPAAVSVNISNTGSTAQVLESVSVGDAAAEFGGANGHRVRRITIPAGGSLLLGGPGQPALRVADARVKVGGYAKVTFVFDSAGTVTTQASVVSARGRYADFAPSAEATPSASASASPTGSASPTRKVSPKATGSSAPADAGSSAGTSTGSAASASASGSPSASHS